MAGDLRNGNLKAVYVPGIKGLDFRRFIIYRKADRLSPNAEAFLAVLRKSARRVSARRVAALH